MHAETPDGRPAAFVAVPPGIMRATMRVFDLALGQMLWSRRTLFMLLVVGLPVLVAAALRLLTALEVDVFRAASGPVVFGLLFWAFFVRLAIPVLAVFYGTALIADEIDDKTITYLFVRPVPRASVLLGKYLAYLVCTAAVTLPAAVVMWLLLAPVGGTLARTFPDLLKDLGVIVAGLVAYGSVFALIGATLKRPLVSGLIFVFGWEPLAMALPGSLRQLTVSHYLQGLVPHALPTAGPIGALQAVFRSSPSLTESLLGLTIVTAVTLVLATRAVARREYVLEH